MFKKEVLLVRTDQHYNLDNLKLDQQKLNEEYECTYIPTEKLKGIFLENKKSYKNKIFKKKIK